MLVVRLILCLLLVAPFLVGQNLEAYLAGLKSVRLDPEQCYRVRDLFLEREDVRLYFTDGLLIFAEHADGRDIGAFFIAEEDTDSAEILIIPPISQERYSLTSFTGEGVLNRPFNHSVLLFSDDTADVLREGIATRSASTPDPEIGERLSRRWTPVFRNLLNNVALRIATDLLSDIPKSDGLFAAAIGGGVTGRFDVVVEPRAESEQLSIGQNVRRDGALFLEIWSRFTARSFRTGMREPVRFGGSITSYDIDVRLAHDLAVEVTAKASFLIEEPGRRAFPFGLSGMLEMTEIRVDGEAAEFVYDSNGTSTPDGHDLNIALLVLPKAPFPGETLELGFDYRGRLVELIDNDVYLVRSRMTWYPRGRYEPSDYRLTFHYPASLDLRATGRLVETTTNAVRKTSVFETEQPINLAGFNLGSYFSAVREIEDYRIEVVANRELESRLQARPNYPTKPPPSAGAGDPAQAGPRSRGLIQIPTAVSSQPGEQVENVANEVAQAFQYFLERFGPPITRDLSVTPVPDQYGQGFPGLVYAPTLSYLDPTMLPLSGMLPSQRAFYKEALFPHEISHQWWGNLVAVNDTSDAWLVEALATYSALLYLEQAHETEALARFLSYYQTNLLRRNLDGDRTESAGPLVLGDRLTSSRFPNALGIIIYGKGAWVMHMLRAEIGDKAFAELLNSLPRDFAETRLTTETFQKAVAAYLPADSSDADLSDFFDQWIYGTGMPRLSVTWSQKRGQIEGELTQRDVPDYFSVPVTIEFATSRGPVRRQVRTGGPVTEFSFAIAETVVGVSLDPDRRLLASID